MFLMYINLFAIYTKVRLLIPMLDASGIGPQLTVIFIITKSDN